MSASPAGSLSGRPKAGLYGAITLHLEKGKSYNLIFLERYKDCDKSYFNVLFFSRRMPCVGGWGGVYTFISFQVIIHVKTFLLFSSFPGRKKCHLSLCKNRVMF